MISLTLCILQVSEYFCCVNDDHGMLGRVFVRESESLLLLQSPLGHQYNPYLIEPILFFEQSKFHISIGSSLSTDRVGRCCMVGPVVIQCVGQSKGHSLPLGIVDSTIEQLKNI